MRFNDFFSFILKNFFAFVKGEKLGNHARRLREGTNKITRITREFHGTSS